MPCEGMIDTYCGLKCYICKYRKKNICNGCIATKGNPFHGKCEVADCVISKNLKYCGECDTFPCELLIKYSYNKKYGDDGKRIEHCKILKVSNNISAGEIITYKGKPKAQNVNILTQEEMDEML